ncbi:hypothetical protein G7046_g340 [Stylonectria norvegica]|nr:hypothetical protein G7046_g340 [Stylonectria norvegica]
MGRATQRVSGRTRGAVSQLGWAINVVAVKLLRMDALARWVVPGRGVEETCVGRYNVSKAKVKAKARERQRQLDVGYYKSSAAKKAARAVSSRINVESSRRPVGEKRRG